jgi:hypothetical protein
VRRSSECSPSVVAVAVRVVPAGPLSALHIAVARSLEGRCRVSPPRISMSQRNYLFLAWSIVGILLVFAALLLWPSIRAGSNVAEAITSIEVSSVHSQENSKGAPDVSLHSQQNSSGAPDVTLHRQQNRGGAPDVTDLPAAREEDFRREILLALKVTSSDGTLAPDVIESCLTKELLMLPGVKIAANSEEWALAVDAIQESSGRILFSAKLVRFGRSGGDPAVAIQSNSFSYWVRKGDITGPCKGVTRTVDSLLRGVKGPRPMP